MSTARILNEQNLSDVYSRTFDARNKWRNILLALNVDISTIDSIGSQCRDIPDECYREGLAVWLRGGQRSWSELIAALSDRTVGYNGLAGEIERSFISQEEENGIRVLASKPVTATPEPAQGIETTLNPSTNSALTREPFDGAESPAVKSMLEEESPLLPPSPHSDTQLDERVRSFLSKLVLSDKIKERLRFVVERILGRELTNKTPLEIYDTLQNEMSAKRATALIYKALTCSIPSTDSNTSQKLTKLETLHDPECLRDSPDAVTKLQCCQQLLEFGDHVTSQSIATPTNPVLFQRLICQFDEEKELGKAHGDIKSPIKLFKCLFHKNVLPKDSPKGWVEVLNTRLLSLQESNPHFEINIPGEPGRSPSVIVSNPPGTNTSVDTVKKMKCPKKCWIWTSGLCFLLLVLCLAAPVAFNVITAQLSARPISTQVQLIGKVTTLERINNQYYERIQFLLNDLGPDVPNVTICTIDCTNSNPATFIHQSAFNSTSMQRGPRPDRRLLYINPDGGTDMIQSLIHLMENSSIMFSLEDFQLPIELHIFTSYVDCTHFWAGSEISSFRTLLFNSSNDYSERFSVPPNTPPSYYCGVWAVNSTVMFDFHVEVSIVQYQLIGSCESMALDSQLIMRYHRMLPVSVAETYTCVLLAQNRPEAAVSNATIHFSASFPSPIFAIFTSISVVIFALLIFCIVAFFYHLCVS